MRYFRVFSENISKRTNEPGGIFTTAGWIILNSGLVTEEETAEYWRTREYFEKLLPVPPFYEQGNPECAVTWFKDNENAADVWSQMDFYRRICKKYGTQLFVAEYDGLPGKVIYEDDFQIAVVNTVPDAYAGKRPLEDN